MQKKGYLQLENGTVLEGVSFGADTQTPGEVVFTTGMMGYPEAITDPSFTAQILVMTYPLIGNYGAPERIQDARFTIHDASKRNAPTTNSPQPSVPDVFESDRIHTAGLVVSSYVECSAHWQAKQTLDAWLKAEGIPALSGIDTRTLTLMLREKGVMKGHITCGAPPEKRTSFEDPNARNLVAAVSCTEPMVYGEGRVRILLIDCGLKYNQIRILTKLGVTVVRIPWNWNPFEKEVQDFDGIIISNGPGDPKMVPETVAIVKEALKRNIPTFGICLGNQILALAAGADTYKLKYGNRGQNQPVREEGTDRCFITTQNHGFAVDTASLPSGWKPWFTNLNDSTNEGIRHEKLPFFSIQFHPEASPGPKDTEWLFEYFLQRVKEEKKK